MILRFFNAIKIKNKISEYHEMVPNAAYFFSFFYTDNNNNNDYCMLPFVLKRLGRGLTLSQCSQQLKRKGAEELLN